MKSMHGTLRWAVGLAAVAALLMAVEGRVVAQTTTTVFSDTFGTSGGSTYTTSGTIPNNPSWSVLRSGVDMGARIDSGIMTLTNDASGSTNANGWVYAYAQTSGFSSPWSSTLSSNPGLVT